MKLLHRYLHHGVSASGLCELLCLTLVMVESYLVLVVMRYELLDLVESWIKEPGKELEELTDLVYQLHLWKLLLERIRHFQ